MIASSYFYLDRIKMTTMEALAGTISVSLDDQSIIFNPHSMWGIYMFLVGFIWRHTLHIYFSLYQ